MVARRRGADGRDRRSPSNSRADRVRARKSRSDALNREAHLDLSSALDDEARIQASLMTDADFREAYCGVRRETAAEVPVMRIACVGGGPGGLYFRGPDEESRSSPPRSASSERNRPDDTLRASASCFPMRRWPALPTPTRRHTGASRGISFTGTTSRCTTAASGSRPTGHGFSGMSRHTLLRVLQEQALAPRASSCCSSARYRRLDAWRDADLLVAADGSNSVGSSLARTIAMQHRRSICGRTVSSGSARRSRFRHSRSISSTTITACGASTPINTVPTARRSSSNAASRRWKSAGMDRATEQETAAFLERLFAEELAGHPLITNRSIWRQFPTVRTAAVVERATSCLLGDAAHTAHFSVGSGTRMAMEDAVALRDSLVQRGPTCRRRCAPTKPAGGRSVESLQRAAQASLQWFEDTERYMSLDPVQFVFSLLTRSLRITHEDLRAPRPEIPRARRLNTSRASKRNGRWRARQQLRGSRAGSATSAATALPPMFTPFRLRDLVLPNRVVVSPMCQYVGGRRACRRLAPGASRQPRDGRRRAW